MAIAFNLFDEKGKFDLYPDPDGNASVRLCGDFGWRFFDFAREWPDLCVANRARHGRWIHCGECPIFGLA
jgi:hypothetical protein